jgi:hypothetical protein
MKKAAFLGTLVGATAIGTLAFAFQPTLKNEDSKTYKYQLVCGGSTTHSSISGNTSTSIGGVGCKLVIEGAGAAKLAEDTKCVIKKSTLDCT